jgi:hypothetical protein
VTLFACVAAAVGSAGAGAAVPTTWCGLAGPQSSTDRKPDLVAGNQIGIIYAHPTGQPDQIATFGNMIATDLASGDAWWRQQELSTRTLRFDLFAFPNCSGMGRLDIVDFTLPHDGEYYRPLSDRYTRITNDLFQVPALASPYKKYVVYFDGPADTPNTCGQGGGDYLRGPDYAIVYAQACSLMTQHAFRAHVAVHELIHAMGAVAPGAPNECPPPNQGHVCDSTLDILYYEGSFSTTLDTDILDVGRNDYYGTNGPQDIRKSAWLMFLDAQVQSDVVLTGTGTGSVKSDVPGIECPALCSNTWNLGTQFTLTATPGPNTRFVKWTGPCGSTDPACVVTMSSAVHAEALFANQIPLTLTVDASRASGTVISDPAGISCPGTCTANFDQGQAVTLIAQPGSSSRLETWGGECSGSGACSVTVDQALTVTATFGLRFRRLTASFSGKGKIVSSPAGISCPPRCGAQFDADSTVSLRAVPAKGYKLTGWTGACKGKAARCSVTMSGNKSARATFKRR